MPVDFDWLNEEKTVMVYTIAGNWNWNDLHKNLRRSTLWWDDVEYPVEVIIDLSGSPKLPAGAVGHLRSIGVFQHANSPGRAVLVGVPLEVQTALGAHDGVYRDGERELRFAADQAAAQAIIAAWRG